MIRKGGYYYGRKVFGNNNKFEPLSGQNPSSADVSYIYLIKLGFTQQR
jgi:hypothetical protein